MDPTIDIALRVIPTISSIYGSVMIARFLYEVQRKKAQLHKDVDTAKEVLGFKASEEVGKVDYKHASVHPLFLTTHEIHPDNRAALVAVTHNEYLRAKEKETLVVVNDLKTDLSTNLVLVGSPTSDDLTRVTFGYQPDIDPDSLTLASNIPVDLPYKWVLDKAQIDEHAQVKRFVPGKGLVARPNWRIEGPQRIFVPEPDSEGLLSVDYLLVTHLRNYLSATAYGSNRFLISFGGTHGAATRAVELLLRDQDVLRQIGHSLSQHPAAYQLVLKVGGMKHDPQSGTRATKIELACEPIILPDSEGVWRTANTLVRDELHNWAALGKAS